MHSSSLRANSASRVPVLTLLHIRKNIFSAMCSCGVSSPLYLLRPPVDSAEPAQAGSMPNRCLVYICSYRWTVASWYHSMLSAQHCGEGRTPKLQCQNHSHVKCQGSDSRLGLMLEPRVSSSYAELSQEAGGRLCFCLCITKYWLAVRAPTLNGWKSLIDCVKILWSFHQTP